ncbi:MAG: D-alanyl-D-alanine carboxypeptidase family protein [bacterium]|nr:D-alanyl-D-alanine carboxypeptidase family protein [bacterium]MDZ4231175.1 D-alanyl-D-alanine carboxypeptidase family protein [Patescibacteria group bacterium]
MQRTFFSKRIALGSIGAVLGLVVIAAGFAYWNLWDRYQVLESDKLALEERLGIKEEDLSQVQDEKVNLQSELEGEREKVQDLGKEVGDIAETVGVLDKLSKLDAELLQKYSKVSFLNEHYIPSSLSPISMEYRIDAERNLLIHSSVLSYLEDMLSDAKDDGVEMYVTSAYRSFGTQSSLKAGYIVTYGAGTANSFSADQGYSEHQLGTTVDVTTKDIGVGLSGFGSTDAYIWLQENAYKYGFILSYPSGNAYYIFEPWHWRFVGVKLARDLHRQGESFYGVDQREIDKYLVYIFD